MKIGIDCRLIDKIQNSGISRYTEFLIKYYVSHYPNSDIFLITNDKSLKYINCSIVYTKLRPYRFQDFILYHNLIKPLNFTIFHVPFYSGFFVKLNCVKVIVTVHDLMYRLVDGFFSKNFIINWAKAYYFDFIVKRSLNNADKIISVSNTTRADILKEFGLNSLHIPEHSELISNPDDSILTRFHLKKKGFFLYCGNARPHKNLEFIISIFSNEPGLPLLVLAGKGHKASNNVIPTGIVSDEQLQALYRAAIGFIFPSKYEGFGLPVLESLMSESFVVASNIPAFLEFKSKNIFFFDLGNEVQFLSAIREAMTAAFIREDKFFENYQKQSIYCKIDDLIKELLDKNTL